MYIVLLHDEDGVLYSQAKRIDDMSNVELRTYIGNSSMVIFVDTISDLQDMDFDPAMITPITNMDEVIINGAEPISAEIVANPEVLTDDLYEDMDDFAEQDGDVDFAELADPDDLHACLNKTAWNEPGSDGDMQHDEENDEAKHHG